MEAAYNFYTALFANLPPKVVPVDDDKRKHVLVYTDACYDEDGYSGVGVIIVDTESNEVFESGGAVPLEILQWMKERNQQINQLEALALTCARMTFPEATARRRVLHYIDNTAALSAAVHGYARAADMAAFVNALHYTDALHEVDAWYEWVPSKANIADLPSRRPETWSNDDREAMASLRARPGYTARKLEWPTIAELDEFNLMAERLTRTAT